MTPAGIADPARRGRPGDTEVTVVSSRPARVEDQRAERVNEAAALATTLNATIVVELMAVEEVRRIIHSLPR